MDHAPCASVTAVRVPSVTRAPAMGAPAAVRTVPDTTAAHDEDAPSRKTRATRCSNTRKVMETPPPRKRILRGLDSRLPYAGINRIRFEGLISGRYGHP